MLSGLPFVLSKHRVVTVAVPPFRWRAFVTGFWVDPRRNPDFAWAWFTRFLVNLGNAIALLYLFYFLADPGVSAPTVARGTFTYRLPNGAIRQGTLLISITPPSTAPCNWLK